ncbi:RraA family protein [Bradyrhizobium sp. GCM10027634]|uniref:Putative 4-hydroxy-4-methyl-2-oxoglutarate aldolase n=3 Tax=Nitrobacteraceae TaxID=41294 RepID=A0A9X1RAX2_9BRAD|nr:MULTISPECIES: RraA family protein [Bradyrhizobium]MCG2628220.1 RraA family protein [Bradyrhizobium zhengyangense]GGI25771.1 diguanylate cyclase [Bradyrhizobium guangdongense]MCG2643339.1 RraA family protein [Bradyrhizobium zhengyangense]MCG2670347.1 RraA family protein [Bradyrhizobium zhengyangense]MDN5002703.1 RraA family protein [Bradyrhizobium sp. WYCCWR 12677]
MTTSTTSDIVARLMELDTCAVSDALDKLNLPGAVIGVSALTGPTRVAGRAVTTKLGAPLPNLPKRHLGAGAVMAAERGDIIVVEHRGRTDVSGWGGLLSLGAVKKGVSAILIDGACRDLDESRALGLPVFARAAVPVTARGRIAEHSFQEPITFGNVAVKPGDYVLADGSGVVFVDQLRAEEIIATEPRTFLGASGRWRQPSIAAKRSATSWPGTTKIC